jgi:hypothetical protein
MPEGSEQVPGVASTSCALIGTARLAQWGVPSDCALQASFRRLSCPLRGGMRAAGS